MTGQSRRLRQRLRERLGRAISDSVGKPEIHETPHPPSPPEPARAPGAHLSLRSQAPHLYPDRASLAASANPQSHSLFFTTLPAELRQLIYASMWRTAGHLHGIHIEHDRREDRLTSEPCVLGYEESWAAEAVNAELDAEFVARRERGRGEIRVAKERWWEMEASATRTHMQCGDDGVYGERNAARFRTGADPLALWAPFLPVLLTCKRVYLESIDTIFTTLPPIFHLNYPRAAHAFFAQDPHPSTAHLQSVTLYSDSFGEIPGGPSHPDRLMSAVPTAGPAAAQWACTLAVLARLPALREVRVALRYEPFEEEDVRPLAWWAGRSLAARFMVDLRREERVDPCWSCGWPPARFVVPEAGDGCPLFGRVRWHEQLRYEAAYVAMSPGECVVSEVDLGLCIYCTLNGVPFAGDGGGPPIGP